MHQNAHERTRMHQNAPECTRMWRNALRAHQNIPECTKNKALDKGKDSKAAAGHHFARKDFKYVTPVLKKDVMTDQVK